MAADRFALSWRLTVDSDDAGALRAALAPESGGHLTLAVEGGTLVATGQGSAGATLHTLDDLLACLSAAEGALTSSSPRGGRRP